ncbi:MAG TPA: 3-isopropylmalate dehydrogenase [Blastocatellia bacterium]|nr:3-isopropylmalate dehydrogenase [Blastocatellia bacterium]
MNAPIKARIVALPGDGIGPEVVEQGIRVLQAVCDRFDISIDIQQHLIGGAALDVVGVPFPPETLEACLHCDAVLLGAVGAPQYDDNPPHLKPEAALLGLRKALGAFANLRPAKIYPSLVPASTLKPEVVKGTDLLIVRELTGGLYFGQPRGFAEDKSEAFNTMRYAVPEIERVARVAFEAAAKRRGKVLSVDKANVLEVSQLWRNVVKIIAKEYPNIQCDYMYVDNCAMQLVANPRSFDVILTENLFGDILSDEAAMLTGSIGMLPSASIGGRTGIYEPVHGSAPDIAGKGIANPYATILSVAMMLRYSLKLNEAANMIENAVEQAVESGFVTSDIKAGSIKTTVEVGAEVCKLLSSLSASVSNDRSR